MRIDLTRTLKSSLKPLVIPESLVFLMIHDVVIFFELHLVQYWKSRRKKWQSGRCFLYVSGLVAPPRNATPKARRSRVFLQLVVDCQKDAPATYISSADRQKKMCQ